MKDQALFEYTLALADDALVSAQRMGWWISRAPELEEDVALANIGLDQLGQARTLLTHAGELEGEGRSEDDLAYLRDDREFRNVKLVERPMTDFGVAMARLLVFSTYQLHLYRALVTSQDQTLAGVAAKAVKEVAYHVDHAAHWVLRLGDGTEESHQRMLRAMEDLNQFIPELFSPANYETELAGKGQAVSPEAMEGEWYQRVNDIFVEAGLPVWQAGKKDNLPVSGKNGIHTEHLGHLLAEMQFLQRTYPGAIW